MVSMKKEGLEEDFVKLEDNWGGSSEHFPCGGIEEKRMPKEFL